ncbi:hypothetical protein TVAG_139650 [Trichomonas vaginalis G3]|uniref:Uncharacterized protein n=1 Tax=Trichomonas vaginalis (strain ATCC PRA-98 / G3) TaxID=412133 RepID=A2EJ32_TRIV3|nr:zinc ion binding [Trichomonas vaginalis G3]EAY07335.1 hypothetical protein TVAG_139650 [Trichomonas vaginalis G3]KAI5524508.1 zinc ion binding [Trichomonas vaginalis G3]|eukprot:XP_001319558.1 hypothetical protein [Trichomonas vaginalis G3]
MKPSSEPEANNNENNNPPAQETQSQTENQQAAKESNNSNSEKKNSPNPEKTSSRKRSSKDKKNSFQSEGNESNEATQEMEEKPKKETTETTNQPSKPETQTKTRKESSANTETTQLNSQMKSILSNHENLGKEPSSFTKEEFVDSLKSVGDSPLKNKLEQIIKTGCPGLNYLRIINNKEISLKDNTAKRGVLSKEKLLNFRIPVKISGIGRQNPGVDIVQYVINGPTNCVEEFCSKTENFCRPLDVIGACARLNKITEEEHKALVQGLDHRIFDNAPRVFSYISNGLSNGRFIKDQTVHSYTKKRYPIGAPSCKGVDPLAKSLLNLYYVAVEQRTSGSEKPHIIQQVSNNLEAVEDYHAAHDVEIARNECCRRHLLEYGSDYIWTAPDLSDEMKVLFGKSGCLFLKLLDYDKKGVLYEKIVHFLNMRGANLQISRLLLKPKWSRTLELYFPTSRAHFQKTPKHINDYSMYKDVRPPLPFKRDNIAMITTIFDKFFIQKTEDPKPPQPEEIEKWKQTVNKMIGLLRVPDDIPMMLTYSQAAMFSSLCILSQRLEVVRVMTQVCDKGRKIPLEIGLTDYTMAGAERVFEIAVETIINKKRKLKDGLLEIAGLFRKVDITLIAELLKIMLLAIKTLKHLSQTDNKEGPLVRVVISGDVVEMALQDLKINEPPLSIDLEQFKPKEGFR